MTDTPPAGVDIELFIEMRELMEEEFGQLIETYLEDTPKLLAEISDAIGASNSVEASSRRLISAAHQLKSTSGSLGLVELENIARTLEEMGEEGSGIYPADLYQQARASFDQLKPFLMAQLT